MNTRSEPETVLEREMYFHTEGVYAIMAGLRRLWTVRNREHMFMRLVDEAVAKQKAS